MTDEAAGNVASARRNLKLALAFDPGNPKYRRALAGLGRDAPEASTTEHEKQEGVDPRASAASPSDEEERAARAVEKALASSPKAPRRRGLRDLLIRRK